MITFDYETEAIDGNVHVNPPRPVGVAIKVDDKPSEYLAWGHPSNNNMTLEKAKAKLESIFKGKEELLAHNSAFEYSISKAYFGFKLKDPLRLHDTQFSLFMCDPYASSFALKPSAERILGLPPEEQDELRDWILHHVPGSTKKNFGAHISKAPGDLVGRYACGDTDRAWALHQKLYARVLSDGMLAAYRREQKLMPVLVASSQRGIRIDRNRLEQDVEKYLQELAITDALISKKLGKETDVDSDEELANALEQAGLITEWIRTPTGRRSTSRRNIEKACNDQETVSLLSYRGALATCLRTFALPWLRFSEHTGRVHTEWNQVRGDRSSRDVAGARTGRLSSMEPNFQNLPNEFPEPPAGRLPPMLLRSYFLPEEGHVWLKRDFSSQEMRIMAHFAEGKLFDAYKENPSTDPHDLVRGIIKDLLSMDMPRKYVKITGFGIMYGRGVPNLSEALGVDQEEGRAVRDAYFTALPEVRTLSNQCRNRGRSGRPIRTWGGRLYYTEPNAERDLSYKLLNYLIQGSAADQTKDSIVDWEASREQTDTFLATVHDEINISAPEEDVENAMTRLRESMNKDRFDVPFLSDGFVGPNWAELKEHT